MKFLKNTIKSVFFCCLLTAVFIFGSLIFAKVDLCRDYKIKKGEGLNIESFLPVTAVYKGNSLTQRNNFNVAGREYEVDLKLFGIIPLSSVNVEVVDELRVAVLGQPFGMKLYTDGVLVIDLTEVKIDNGTINPATRAGLKKGDYILSVDGKKITTNEELGAIVEASNGDTMDFLIKRDGKKMHISFSAVFSNETGSYKIGVWVRDSSAGIGTLTFYSPATGIICGLGHGICDEDTETLLELESGEIVSAEIIGIEKGSSGAPGQLKGRFGLETLGNIDLNSHSGVYSYSAGDLNYDGLYDIAFKQDIKEGEAQILCTVDGEGPKSYSCTVKMRSASFHSRNQNMVVTVTDEKLLELTGGIVQGMSGSPIIQNGKLIGAVTHVLVDDPTKGYGIFAENMLETARSVVQSQALKDAG